MTRRKVVAVTTSPLPYGDNSTDGPGYRMWNLLEQISPRHEVHVISLYESFHRGERGLPPLEQDGLWIERPPHAPGVVRRRIRDLAPDVLYVPWSATAFLGGSNRRVPTLVDYVGPGLLESLVGGGHVPLPLLRLKLQSFRSGDFLMTTSEAQRHYLIGLLAAAGRLSEGEVAASDPLVHVVRMTPPSSPPPGERTTTGDGPLRILLGGSFLPWYDYGGLARALRELDPGSRSLLRLVIAGESARLPGLERRVQEGFQALAAEGVAEFRPLLPFRRRFELYRDADLALSVAPASVEDELAARTRIVDGLWAGLPVLTNGRDEYSALVVGSGAGFAFEPAGGPLAELVRGLAADRSRILQSRSRIRGLLEGPLNGAKQAAPVLAFIEHPYVSDRGPRAWTGPMRAGLWLRDVAMAVRRGRM